MFKKLEKKENGNNPNNAPQIIKYKWCGIEWMTSCFEREHVIFEAYGTGRLGISLTRFTVGNESLFIPSTMICYAAHWWYNNSCARTENFVGIKQLIHRNKTFLYLQID